MICLNNKKIISLSYAQALSKKPHRTRKHCVTWTQEADEFLLNTIALHPDVTQKFIATKFNKKYNPNPPYTFNSIQSRLKNVLFKTLTSAFTPEEHALILSIIKPSFSSPEFPPLSSIEQANLTLFFFQKKQDCSFLNSKELSPKIWIILDQLKFSSHTIRDIIIFTSYLRNQRSSTLWLQEERNALIDIMKKHAETIVWAKIRREFNVIMKAFNLPDWRPKTTSQIRFKWTRSLNPSICKDPFTDEEKKCISELYESNPIKRIQTALCNLPPKYALHTDTKIHFYITYSIRSQQKNSSSLSNKKPKISHTHTTPTTPTWSEFESSSDSDA